MKKKGFSKEDRSSFPYWFSHWCAFQMTALNLHVWKFKYLFHDFEKPWLKLFLNYKKVQKIHRKINRHHLSYKNPERIDWEALAIDWECCRYTKIDCPLSARETFNAVVAGEKAVGEGIDPYVLYLMLEKLPIVLKKLGL